jgi:hypothetical protein
MIKIGDLLREKNSARDSNRRRDGKYLNQTAREIDGHFEDRSNTMLESGMSFSEYQNTLNSQK